MFSKIKDQGFFWIHPPSAVFSKNEGGGGVLGATRISYRKKSKNFPLRGKEGGCSRRNSPDCSREKEEESAEDYNQ